MFTYGPEEAEEMFSYWVANEHCLVDHSLLYCWLES